MVIKTFFLTTLILAFTSCGPAAEESPHAQYPQLLAGEWQLQTAYRDSVPTQLLEGTFFRFKEGNRLETNLPLAARPDGSPLLAGYTLRADSLFMVSDLSKDQLFVINRIDSQELWLSTVIRGIPFQFELIHN